MLNTSGSGASPIFAKSVTTVIEVEQNRIQLLSAGEKRGQIASMAARSHRRRWKAMALRVVL
ncbi:hypothetical protein [Microtetraspora sp. NBRC 16547]|uniref:hypothetical protein n=1 Tax=Microtetraspora sp. NBRC 16547 TaxID=3030993 RepID=UPI002553433F|nr:hypothetical protein [Microtetraspora sp. NBRC 16547]